jgi:ENTS family enterobactin (siderophore) exporter
VLGLTHALPVALVVIAVAGCAEAVTEVVIVSLMQTSVRDELMGKTFSAWATIANIGDSASGLIVGFLLGAFSVPAVFLGAGTCAVLVSCLGALRTSPRAGWRSHRRLALGSVEGKGS